MKLIVAVLKRYKSVTVPVLTRYTSVTVPVMTRYKSVTVPVLTRYTSVTVPVMTRYKSVTVPVLTRYTGVTATPNIYYNIILLCNNDGSSQLGLFICVNYRGRSFYELVCFLVFAVPLHALFSLTLRFC